MGWRFRTSFKVIPGVRLNVSRRSVSTTIGSGPFSVNIGPRGVYGNVNIPGTGVSYRERILGGESSKPVGEQKSAARTASSENVGRPSQPYLSGDKQEIRSGSTHEISSEGLEQFRKLLLLTVEEQHSIESEIRQSSQDHKIKHAAFTKWDRGFFFKRMRKARFAALRSEAEEAKARLDELQEQRRLTCVATEIQIADEVKPPFGRLCDAFAKLCGSQFIWDTLSRQRTNQFVRRTAATESIERKRVSFRLGQSDLLDCEWKVPYLENANGGDLFIYPGFILYRVSKQAFALIDWCDIQITLTEVRFIEEETVPSDAQVIGNTWKYANKDGGPDRRFKNNYQIPIVLYGQLSMTSVGGLNEQYLISNANASKEFFAAWDNLRNTLGLKQKDAKASPQPASYQQPLTPAPVPAQVDLHAFRVFCGFTFGDNIVKAQQLFGPPAWLTDNAQSPNVGWHYFVDEYNSPGLTIYHRRTDGIITGVELCSLEAIRQLKARGINDRGTSCLGQHREFIRSTFGQPDEDFGDTLLYFSRVQEGAIFGATVSFTCYDHDNYSCSDIGVNWVASGPPTG